jgi:hypothetical protein
VNSLGDEFNILVNKAGGVINVIGPIALTIIVPIVATSLQPASYVFTHFESQQAQAVGIINPVCVHMCLCAFVGAAHHCLHVRHC